MSKYRGKLPQLSGSLFLTDGGIETTLIFHEGLDLPHFAAFHLLREAKGRDALLRYYERYVAIAKADGLGFILESPTWRASADWGNKLGYTRDEIRAANRDSIRLMLDLRTKHETAKTPMVVSGCVGPRGDGYDPGQVMSPEEAEDYHAHQIGAFAEAKADMVTAITMTNANEAVGVARAALKTAMPVVVSFTLETDSRGGPVYYMINCAHPTRVAANFCCHHRAVQRTRRPNSRSYASNSAARAV
jgi:homocysteine S-methyltransferase